MTEPYTTVGPDPDNASHVIIEVRGSNYSVFKGREQRIADEIGHNKDNPAPAFPPEEVVEDAPAEP